MARLIVTCSLMTVRAPMRTPDWRGGIEAQVLRIAANHGERMHHDPLTEFAVPRDHRVRMDNAAGSKPGTLLDQGSRMDLHR